LYDWTESLGAILRYIASQLPSFCTVEVDDDNITETSVVMKEHFPSGYRKVQTRAGDFIFKRNEFSAESGHWGEHYDDHGIDSIAS